MTFVKVGTLESKGLGKVEAGHRMGQLFLYNGKAGRDTHSVSQFHSVSQLVAGSLSSLLGTDLFLSSVNTPLVRSGLLRHQAVYKSDLP